MSKVEGNTKHLQCQLEAALRERDEAREAIATVQQLHEGATDCYKQAVRERDEARVVSANLLAFRPPESQEDWIADFPWLSQWF